MPRARVGRVQLAPALQYDRAQRGALGQREPLPHRLKQHVLLVEQAREGRMEIVQRRATRPGRAHVVPGFVRQPLHVVGEVSRQVHDGRAQPGLWPDARLREALLDEVGEDVGGNLLEPHHRPGLVEGPARADHLFHQARLRTGEHVAHLALMLRGGPQRVLDMPPLKASMA